MRNATLFLLALLGAGCSNYSANLPSIKPYKMDIQQGNVITSKMMLQLRPGMTHAQVRFVLGTPLLTDSFHADRWDYVYRMQKDGKVIEQRHVILDFEGDSLKRVRGDVIPASSDADEAARPVAGSSQPVVDLKKTEPKKQEKGLLDKLKFWKDDEEKSAPKSEPAPKPEPVKEVAPAASPAPSEAPAKPAAQVPQEAAQPAVEESAPEASGEPTPAEPAGEQAAPQVVSEPATVEAPAAETTPKAEPAPAVEQAPVPKQVAPAKEELKTAPKPEDDLPPEGDPGYFERMLEKIGF